MIGIGITTRNRPQQLNNVVDKIKKFTESDYKLVIVDDASKTPVDNYTYYFKTNVGIPKAKNKCLELLQECTHIFLFDDDCYPIKKGWENIYINSGENHLSYQFEDESCKVNSEYAGIVSYDNAKGCMLYLNSQVLDRVGGFNTKYQLGMFEHKEYSKRVHNAGLTTNAFQDVHNSSEYIYSLDEYKSIKSTLSIDLRKLLVSINKSIYDIESLDSKYIPFGDINKTTVKLSICVLSLQSRYKDFYSKLISRLYAQYDKLTSTEKKEVEIISLVDNGNIKVGQKRNNAINMSSGSYIVFVDDDDRVSENYIQLLLQATKYNKDCITFNASVRLNNAPPKICRYSINYTDDVNTANEYHRLPNHICAIKRSIYNNTKFENINFGEDSKLARDIKPYLKSEFNIDSVLYFYDYNDQTSATQNSKYPISDKLVDVIILSNARNDKLKSHTQDAINSCRNTTNSANIIVIEQNPEVSYDGVLVKHITDNFNYNRFANIGASFGKSKYILISNNDVIFKDNWLDYLLLTNYPVMSPKEPQDVRQTHITQNESGYVNGTHFSGWCFMITRNLWKAIDGFDERVDFWCSDDIFLEQLKEINIKPILVVDSKVEHLGSQTLVSLNASKRDELCWGNVSTFNKITNQDKFITNPNYESYRNRNNNTKSS